MNISQPNNKEDKVCIPADNVVTDIGEEYGPGDTVTAVTLHEYV